MPHFFISYAHDDAKHFAQVLHDDLESSGFDIWLDRHDIQPPANWDEAIEKALRGCAAVIALITPKSLASQVCRNEWQVASNASKPILPILITPENGGAPSAFADLPLLFARAQAVNFVRDGEAAGFAQVRKGLRNIQTLQAEIAETARKLHEYQQGTTDAPRPDALASAIGDLQSDLAIKRRALLEPGTVAAEQAQSLQTLMALQRQAQKQASERATRGERRVVGMMPQALPDSFKDRERERAEITNYLIADGGERRIISVIGRGGMGKTALACTVLQALEGDHARIHGIAYLSGAERARTLTLQAIYDALGAMLGGEDTQAIRDIWTNVNLTPEARAERLLERVGTRRCVLLLDNLEDMLDVEGRIHDDDLRPFIDLLLRRPHGVRLLITTREPLKPADDAVRYQFAVPLDEGLPEPYAVELLRDLDRDGELGLREGSAATLAEIARRTHGIPRALEAVVGLLVSDPFLTPEALLKDARLWGDRVTRNLVERAQSRLNADARRVMQALALYGKPVPEAAVRHLLEPLAGAGGIDVAKTLRLLARGRYLTINRASGTITMHPLDREHNYAQLDENKDECRAWEARAADYYAALKGTPADWGEYADLEPALEEFDHRVKAGDYAAAFGIIDTIGFDYLRRWGHSARELELRHQLVSRLGDERSEAINQFQMGQLYIDLADYRAALAEYEAALPVADKDVFDPGGGGRVLGAIGDTYWYLQDYPRALDYLERALARAREVKDETNEASALHTIGNVYVHQGRMTEALYHYQQSLAIKERINAEWNVPPTLSAIARLYIDLGDLAAAREYAERSMYLSLKLKDRPGVGSEHNRLGTIDEYEGRYADALAHYTQALRIAEDVGDRRWKVYALCNLAALHPQIGSSAEAEQRLAEARALAEEIASPGELSYAYRRTARHHLITGAFADARDWLLRAAPHERPDSLFRQQRDLAIAHLRLGDSDAGRDAFNACLDDCAKLLADTANLWHPKYARGLALCGLWLLTGDDTYLDIARDAYAAGRANCAAPGILNEQRLLLGILAGGAAEAERERVMATFGG